MEKHLLDNKSCQDIKELIADEIVNLQELDDSALEKVLDFETEMLCHGSGDMDIIRQCSHILDERRKSDKLNEEAISAIINKTKAEHVTIIDADNSRSDVVTHKRIRFVFKRIAIVAAAIMIALTSTFAIAVAFGVDIFEYLKIITGKPDGTTVNIDEFTFYNLDSSKQYDSIQEMVECENLDIMYPALLPDGIDIESIRLTNTENGKNTVQIFTNDSNVNIQIELDSNEIQNSSGNIYEHNNKTYYIFAEEQYLATCYYQNNKYYISAKTYEDLILIIDNMKE